MIPLDVDARVLEPGEKLTEVLLGLEKARGEAGIAAGGPDGLAWDWRLAAPLGVALSTAREPGGPVLSAVVALRRAALLEGEDCVFLELAEIFNVPGAQGGLARARALRAAGEAFAKTHGGRFPDGAPVMFGIPTRGAHRFGLRRFAWEILRSENELALAPGRFAAGAVPGVEAEEVARFPEGVEALGQRFAASRSALLVRDAAHLDWRYVARPGKEYKRALVRRGDEIRGLAVLDGNVLVEWLVPPDEPGVGLGLLAWALETTTAAGGEELVIRVPDTSPEWLGLQSVGFRARGTDDYLCFRSFHKPYVMSWLFKNWWYTLGDIDLRAPEATP